MQPANSLERLTSADSVFDALGGVSGVMELTGSKYKTVHAWKQAGAFPARLYLMMTAALKKRGYSSDPSLWGMAA